MSSIYSITLRSARALARHQHGPLKVAAYQPIPSIALRKALTFQKRRKSSSTTAPLSSTSSSPPPSSFSSRGAPQPPPLPSRVNGPASTLPAALDLPVRQPKQPFFFAYAFSLGKAYVGFYKSGAKAVWANYKAARDVQQRLNGSPRGHRGSAPAAAAASGLLDRHDLQLLVRNRFDTRRIPAFALVLLVFGEFTPLVVLAVSGIVPYTCRIPRQVEADRATLERRRSTSFSNLTRELPPLPSPSPPPRSRGQEPAQVRLPDLDRMQLLHVSWSLGLCSSAWDWLGGRLPGLPTAVLRRRARARLEYLDVDDALIAKGGGVARLNVEELRIALEERGVNVLGRSDEQLRSGLNAWLQSKKSTSMERLLLTRPSVWPSKPSFGK